MRKQFITSMLKFPVAIIQTAGEECYNKAKGFESNFTIIQKCTLGQ